MPQSVFNHVPTSFLSSKLADFFSVHFVLQLIVHTSKVIYK